MVTTIYKVVYRAVISVDTAVTKNTKILVTHWLHLLQFWLHL